MAHAQRVEAEDAGDQQTTSFSNKPVVLADNGRGTKVKLWNNKTGEGKDFQTVSIERSYKPKGSEEYKTDKVSLAADDLLAVARGTEVRTLGRWPHGGKDERLPVAWPGARGAV